MIGQKELKDFREAMTNLKQDPYQFVVKQSKLPMSLLTDPVKSGESHLLSSETFEDTFGRKSKRKRPNVGTLSMEELRAKAEERADTYDPKKDRDLIADQSGKLYVWVFEKKNLTFIFTGTLTFYSAEPR